MGIYSTGRVGFGFSAGAAWKQLQVQREKSKAARENFLANNAALTSTFSSANDSAMLGAGDLAAKAAIHRLNQAAVDKVKQNQMDAAKNASVWKNAPAKTSVSSGDVTVDFSGDTIKLSNGTMLNIKTGKPAGEYLTLSDGSQIDLKTGHKVIVTA
jgi:hypothetical protein